MTAVLVIMWLFVVGYARALPTASRAARAQWTTFAIFALVLTAGQDMAYWDNLVGVPNIALVIIHLGAVLAAAAQLEFIATAESLGNRPAARTRLWRPRHTFTAVVCVLIVVAAAADPDAREAASTAAAYGGSFEAAAGRVLMCFHLGVVAYLMGVLCIRTRAAAADRVLRHCLTLMCIGSFIGVAYGLLESLITIALWRRYDLGGFIAAHMLTLDEALISAAFLAYASGCLIPVVHARIEERRSRKAARALRPIWAALVGSQPERSIAGTLVGSATRTYLMRLIVELAEERYRLAAELPPDAVDRLSERLGAFVPEAREAAVEAVVLRAGLEMRHRGEHRAGTDFAPPVDDGAEHENALAAVRWWSTVWSLWDDPIVAAEAAAMTSSIAGERC